MRHLKIKPLPLMMKILKIQPFSLKKITKSPFRRNILLRLEQAHKTGPTIFVWYNRNVHKCVNISQQKLF